MGKKLVFTGGHHNSALEVAKALKNKGWEIIWFGHRHSLWGDKNDSAEYQEVTAAGIKFYDLQAGKFYHTYNPLKLMRLPWGFIQAFFWLLQIRPNGIVSFGGYLAVPTVVCGWLQGIKSVTHEQTLVTGMANKFIANFASKIALTWPESQKYYPPEKSVVVGLPMPENLKNNPASKPTLLIVGGKQGSHILNRAVFTALPQLGDFEIYHQTGQSTLNDDWKKAQQIKAKNYHAFGYDRQQYLHNIQKATVVVARAGAHTVYDIAVLGKKAVLVPIPWVSHHEQELNAQMLANAGLAVVLLQQDLNSESLLKAINQAEKLSGKPLDLAKNATEKMVNLVEEQFA